MIFVGPNDLASSMGYFAFDHASIPEVQAATARVREAASAHGKSSGHFCASGEIGMIPFHTLRQFPQLCVVMLTQSLRNQRRRR